MRGLREIAAVFAMQCILTSPATAVECSDWQSGDFWNAPQDSTFLTRLLNLNSANTETNTVPYLENLSECLKKIENINALSERGYSPLMLASELSDDPAVVVLLFEMGARADTRSLDGTTAIQHAAQTNPNPDILDVLITNGADISEKTHEAVSLLSLAAMGNNSVEVVNRLIELGANPNQPDQFGLVPLHYAARDTKDRQVLDVLIGVTTDIDVPSNLGLTPLHFAAMKGQPLAVETLLTHNADPNAKTYDGGWTPAFGAAVETKFPIVFKMLADAGADMNYQPPNDPNTSTPLVTMLSGPTPRPSYLVEALIEAGASVRLRDQSGINALEAAQIYDAPDDITELLNAKSEQENHINSSDCSLIVGERKRLECYDKTAGLSGNMSINDTDRSGTQWHYEQSTSELDGRSDVWLSVDSVNRQPNQINRLETAQLWVRCMENSTNLFVTFNDYTSRNQNVRYRLDEGPIKSVWMETMAGGDGIGIWSGKRAIPFARTIFDSQTLVVGYDTYSQNSVEFTFDVAGLRQRIGPLAKSCNWTP